jgi:hypothetical protein
MRQEYKVKVNDLISSVEGRIKLINYMIDGTKQANPAEAKQYIREALNGLKKIEELISIS